MKSDITAQPKLFDGIKKIQKIDEELYSRITRCCASVAKTEKCRARLATVLCALTQEDLIRLIRKKYLFVEKKSSLFEKCKKIFLS